MTGPSIRTAPLTILISIDRGTGHERGFGRSLPRLVFAIDIAEAGRWLVWVPAGLFGDLRFSVDHFVGFEIPIRTLCGPLAFVRCRSLPTEGQKRKQGESKHLKPPRDLDLRIKPILGPKVVQLLLTSEKSGNTVFKWKS